MKTQSSDTDLLFEKKLIKYLRKSTTSKKLAITFNLCSLTMRLSKRALAKKNLQMSKRELDLLFVKLNYGATLANKLNQYYSKVAYTEK